MSNSASPLTPVGRLLRTVQPEPEAVEERREGSRLPLSVCVAAGGLAAWSITLSAQTGDVGPDLLRSLLVVVWAVAASVLIVRRPDERIGTVVAIGSLIGAIGELGTAAIGSGRGPAWLDALARALGIGLVPAVALTILVGLPDGSVRGRRRALCGGAVVLGLSTAASLWAMRPQRPLWPVLLESGMFGAIALPVFHARYRRATGVSRQRMQWTGWALVVVVEVAAVVGTLRLLVGWPPHAGAVAATAQLTVAAALVAATSRRLTDQVDRTLTTTVASTGLTGVVLTAYIVIVIGLGHVPTKEERTLLLLSMVAAAVTAVLYVPAKRRLSAYATRVVYGQRRAPDDVLRTFGTRLTRAIPLDELLLQAVESLRATLDLNAAEVWTPAGGGTFERTISSPDAPRTRVTLTPDEETVVARAAVSGQAWIRIWLPDLETVHPESLLRVAPIAHSGELLGMIVVARPPTGESFRTGDEQTLAELARQVGLALHNVQLDSALQESLSEVRRQAEELRASRTRIVAAGDAERRRIERNLHDGAQQHLVALAVTLRLARIVVERDPTQGSVLLEQLAADLQGAITELRALAHGIYPPLLMDRGLSEALASAAGRGVLPTEAHADGLGRYPAEVEATVYFCCLEAMQNAAKHAGDGAHITVRVWEEAGGLLFEVRDNGAGFDARARPGGGAGFINMSDRLGAVGGSLRVDSAPGNGTTISGVIPLLEEARA